MKALVTGATGFVGSYLVPELLNNGMECRLLVRSRDKAFRFLDSADIELWEGDVTRPETLIGLAEGIDYVFHLSAVGHVAAISKEAYRQFIEVNVGGTVNLIKECARFQVRKFIHFSSTAAMGLIKKEMVDENDTPRPKTPYQKCKLESEKAALIWGQELEVPTVLLRPCMIYGIGGKGEFYKIARLMKKGLFPKVGRGKDLTPLVHVSDVVQAAIKAAEKGVPGEVYLISSARSLSMDDLRKIIMTGWGTKAAYLYIPGWAMLMAAAGLEILAYLTGKAPLVTRANVHNTIWNRVFSIEKAQCDLDYQPFALFEQHVPKTVHWFDQFN